MKYNNFMKKLAAAVTVVAMIASLGMTAFAANVMVEDYAKANALDITGVDAVYSLNGEIKNYTITVTYTGAASTDQVTVLGYLYDETDAELTAVPAESAIYAVNQEDGSGTTVIKLTSDTTSAKYVTGTETLIIKMGSDAEGITAAQAVRISLADAELQQADLIVNANPVAVEAAVSYGAGKADLMGQLPDLVKVTGTRDEVQDDNGAKVGVVWNVDEAWVANNINGMTVTGTLQETTGVVLGSYTSVTANVTVNSLTTADVVAYEGVIDVMKDATAADVKAKVVSALGGKLGLKVVGSEEQIDTITFVAENVESAVITDTVDNEGTATITVTGDSAKGIFKGVEVTLTVNLKVTDGVLGDMNGDTVTNSADAYYLLRHTMLPAKYPLSGNGDVNGDSVVNSADAYYLLRHTMLPAKYPLYPVQS